MRIRSILSLLGRKAAPEQPAEQTLRKRVREPLPPSVIAAIETASIVVRPGTRETGLRAVVSLGGRPGWIWSGDGAAKVFEAGWPDLPPSQIAQASARLSCLVQAHMQDCAFNSDPTGTAPDARAWKDRF